MTCVRCFSILALLLLTSKSNAEPWSEKLGFPAGAKVVILEARDLGVAWEFNDAAFQLLESGHASTASVVVTGPRFRDVANWQRANPNVQLGVSIALTNPYRNLSWRLLTSEFGSTSLVNADGEPWRSALQVAVTVSADDVKAELDAQLRRCREAGITPSHITAYYGTIYSRSDLAAVFLGASRKYWLPAPVVELTPELVSRFRAEGYPIDQELYNLVRDYPLPKLDDYRTIPDGETFEQKRDLMCDLVRDLKPGLTLVAIRPATESAGVKQLTDTWQQRVWLPQALRDPTFIEVVREQNIILTTWGEVMQRFENNVTPLKAAEESQSSDEE